MRLKDASIFSCFNRTAFPQQSLRPSISSAKYLQPLLLLLLLMLTGKHSLVQAWTLSLPKHRFPSGKTTTISDDRRHHLASRLFLHNNYQTDHDRRWRRPVSALFSSKVWQVGDAVIVNHNNDSSQPRVTGRITENRGRGWYAVQVGKDLVKFRGTQLGVADGSVTSSEAATKLVDVATPLIINTTTPTITSSNDAVGKVPPIKVPPPPTIYDLDALVQQQRGDPSVLEHSEYLEQVAYFQTVRQWVVFTDLHCSPGTLDTCLEVLDRIHVEAVKRQAGIAFLGDWWHVRGTLRVDCLNAVLDRMKDWKQPMVLIPGNHDQVTAAITDNHSLTPLQHAYRVPVVHNSDLPSDVDTGAILKTLPGLLILSHPTIFAKSLWIPHIRSSAVLESVLQSEAAANAVAIFCHTDVTGASMNDNIVSQGGVPPRMFPPDKPIYSGHFHKPHIVTVATEQGESGGEKQVRSIEFLGSPYEISLSEAQQPKSLAVLDASQGWKCIDRIALNVGRKHFRPATLRDFLSLRVAPIFFTGKRSTGSKSVVTAGDRVVFSVNKQKLDDLRRAPQTNPSFDKLFTSMNGIANKAPPTNVLDEQVTLLRKAGVMVEIRDVKELPDTPMSTIGAVPTATEDMSTPSLWTVFLAQELDRGAISVATQEILQKYGMDVLEEFEVAGGAAVDGNGAEFSLLQQRSNATNAAKGTDFQLHSVTVQGFGPFRDEITYPLLNRGLVLVRGSNKDGGSDSNGSGKTSLAMSMLWAFTGSIDPRPLQDSKVSDVVNDTSKAARVTVKGALNGVNFSISRTKTSTKGSLLFLYDDGDLTTQSVKETQDLINEKLGISPQVLARTMFHGQHALNELLESTDTKLKDELSLVVPLSVWQGAVTHTRKQAREAIKSASEFEGMLTIRSEDLFKLEERLEAAEAELESKKAAFETMKGQVHEEIESILTNIGRTHDIKGIAVFEEELHRAGLALEKIELERQSALASRDQDLALQEKEVEFLNSELARFDAELRSAEQELSDQSLNYALANERVVNLQEMWRIDLSSGMPESFALPDNCPTCHQSISSHQDDHLQNLEVTIERDIEGTLARLSAARSIVDETRKAKLLAFLSRLAAEESLSASEKCLVDKRNYWKNLLDEIEKRQGDARAFQQSAATTFASTAKQIEGESRIQSLQARLDAEKGSLELFSNAVDAVRNELIGCKQRVTQIKAEKAEKTSMAKILEDLSDAFGQRGIQTFVMQNAVSSLESFAQAYLDQLSEGAQRLQLTLDSGDRILRRAFVRGADGIYKERALASLSGGQWRRCSLALNLGFSDLVASRANFRPSVCVMDEPLTHLDHSGRADVGRVLRGILRRTSECESDRSVGFHVSTILVILQDLAAEELEESFDCIDEIVKENGVSSLRLEEVGLVV